MKKFINWFRNFFEDSLAGGALDVPDKRDLIDELPIGGHVSDVHYHNNFEIAESVHLRQTGKPLNYELQSRGACTGFGFGIVKVVTSIATGCGIITQNSKLHWDLQQSLYGATPAKGDLLLNSLKVGKEFNQGTPISGYYKIPGNDLNHIKTRLRMGYCIFTGISWKMTLDGKSNTYNTTLLTGIWEWFKTKILSGHCVAVGGFDDFNQVLICRESMKKWWGGNKIIGELLIPYSQVENMMSMYIVKTTKVS